MTRNVSPDDLSEEQLKQLLYAMHNASRQKRLDDYRRRGRVVVLAADDADSPQVSKPTSPFMVQAPALSTAPRSYKKIIINRILPAAEMLAILVLVLILFNGISIINQLNNVVLSGLQQPTLTPTPIIRAIVIPSGHTPPNSPGGSRPNDSEIPLHLRPLVQSFGEMTFPTPGPENAIRMQIPAISVDAPIVQGDGWEQLKLGVAQHLNTGTPGENGNMVFSAHNDIFGEIFRHLDVLVPGDEVTVYTNYRAYTYVVTGTQIVEPTFVEVMDPTPDPTLTLISCYPYLIDTERIIVKASLEES